MNIWLINKVIAEKEGLIHDSFSCVLVGRGFDAALIAFWGSLRGYKTFVKSG